MKYLEFGVNSMTLNRKNGDKTAPISGAVNYFGVSVAFDEDFEAIPGGKAVEFFKNKAMKRCDLIDGKCSIPNEFLKDSGAFEMRIVSGGTVATPWVKIAITESGPITLEEPTEDAPETMEYVKTMSGDSAIPFLRKGSDGMEFSQDGKTWKKGLRGVPEVPSSPNDTMYMRKHGDWVPYVPPEDSQNSDTTELREAVNANTQAIEELKNIEGLTGSASALTELADGETDPATIAAKVNEIISLLKTRGIATT